MRKLFLLVVIVMAAITASAQEGIYLGGGISLWRNNDVIRLHSLSHRM